MAPGPSGEVLRPFNCDDCRDDAGGWWDEKRAERGCVRDDLPPIDPDPLPFGTVRLPIYLGREQEPGLTEHRGRRVSWRYPPENPDEGCPGAWRRCLFVCSLLPFLRRRDDHGGRVANAFYDRCQDEIVLALVHYYEDEHEQSLAALQKAAAHGSRGTT